MAFITSFKPGDFKTRYKVKKVSKALANNFSINNTAINKRTQPLEYSIMLGSATLHQNGLLIQELPGTNANLCARNVLFSLGCSILHDHGHLDDAAGLTHSSGHLDDIASSFSLIGTETDVEGIDNPSILDQKDFNKIKNEQIEGKDKFPNADDPFYELDDQIPQANKIQIDRLRQQSLPNVTGIAVSMVRHNLQNSSKRTLKYFDQ